MINIIDEAYEQEKPYLIERVQEQMDEQEPEITDLYVYLDDDYISIFSRDGSYTRLEASIPTNKYHMWLNKQFSKGYSRKFRDYLVNLPITTVDVTKVNLHFAMYRLSTKSANGSSHNLFCTLDEAFDRIARLRTTYAYDTKSVFELKLQRIFSEI